MCKGKKRIKQQKIWCLSDRNKELNQQTLNIL